MEDKNKQTEEVEIGFTQGSGNLLAAARKQQKKTIEEIADELNLSVTQIKTIELDQTDGLPEPTYVRGYIRAYAKLLGLNPEDVLKNYLNPNWQQTSSLNDIPRGIGNADESEARFLTMPKLIGLLVLLGAAGYMWYSGMLGGILGGSSVQNNTSVTDNAAVVQEAAQSPVTPSPVSPSPVTPSPNAGVTTDSVGNVLEAESIGTNAGEAVAEDVPAAAANLANELVLRFTETSWVDIRDSDDSRLAYKSYAQGEELRVNSESTMSVFIGNAAGVSVEYNGAAFDVSEYREGVYAKFVVGE